MFRAGRAEDEARAAGLVVRDVESWSGCKEERLGLSGRGSRQVRGQSDGDSGQSVSEVSGSARRSSAGNGGKRVPLGAGSAGVPAGVDGRVVEYGRVLATRGAALRPYPYSTRTAPLPALLCRYVP